MSAPRTTCLRGEIGQRFGGSALSFDGVPRRLHVQQREPVVFVYTKARNRIVAAIGGKKKPAIRAENDAAGTLKGVRRAFLSADRLECSRTDAAGSGTFHLWKRAIRPSTIVDDAVADLIGLHVEMSATLTRH